MTYNHFKNRKKKRGFINGIHASFCLIAVPNVAATMMKEEISVMQIKKFNQCSFSERLFFPSPLRKVSLRLFSMILMANAIKLRMIEEIVQLSGVPIIRAA